jgi:hypothetical protein
VCLDGETTEDRGTIQPFNSRHDVTEGQSSCRFTITAFLSKHIQMTCLTTTTQALIIGLVNLNVYLSM